MCVRQLRRPQEDGVAESNCDLLFLCSDLADSIGLVRTINAHRFRPKMVGGGMIGASEHGGKNNGRPGAQRLRELRIPAASPKDDVPRCSAIAECLPGTRQ
jgi:hypothetical protein